MPKRAGRLVVFVDTNEQAHYATKGVDRARFLAENIQLASAVEVRPLTSGDYAFVWRVDDGSSEDTVLALIERKTMQDLLASIMDTRYVSQAERLVATEVPYVFWAIVRGTLYQQADVGRVRTAMCHLNTLPRTRVVELDNGEHAFATELATLARYIVAEYTRDEAESGVGVAPLFSLVRERGEKTRLDTQPIVFEAQLAAVHGMSRKKARAVMRDTPTALSLMQLWARRRREYLVVAAGADAATGGGKKRTGKKRTLEQYVDASLEDVDVGGSRIGPALSERLRVTMCPDVEALAAVHDVYMSNSALVSSSTPRGGNGLSSSSSINLP